jgi:hypothetical protein
VVGPLWLNQAYDVQATVCEYERESVVSFQTRYPVIQLEGRCAPSTSRRNLSMLLRGSKRQCDVSDALTGGPCPSWDRLMY